MKKLLLALLLAVSITPIASVSADTRGGQITPEGNGNGGGGITPDPKPEPKPDPNPNPDQGTGGETTPPQKPEKPQPEPPQKPTPVVKYEIAPGYQSAIILKESEVASTDLIQALGVKGQKIVDGGAPVDAPVTASPVDATKVSLAQEITLTVGEGDAITTAKAKVTVVPDTYSVNDKKGLAVYADKALTLTQTDAKAFNGKVGDLVVKLNAKGISAEGVEVPVYALEDENLNKVITGTPGTWNVQLSTKKSGATTREAQPADTFAVTAEITVTDDNQAVLDQPDATGSIKPEEAATQSDFATTAAGVTGATVPAGVRTGASTNVVALVATLLVATSLIFVVKRTRK